MMLCLYTHLTKWATPWIPSYLEKRAKNGKEVKERLGERYGIPSVPRPLGKLLWFHGASVGESMSLLALITYLGRLYPDLHILLTSSTAAAIQVLKDKLPPHTYHQFTPLDVPDYWEKFLNHWKPDIMVSTESEIWPNRIQACTRKGIPQFLINARLTEKSYKRWRFFSKIACSLFSHFKMILAQSDTMAKRFQNFTPHVQVMPNLKFAAQPLGYDEVAFETLKGAIGQRPTLAFASTHPGEEDLLFPIFQKLLEAHPDLLILLCPRHPQRTENVLEKLKSFKLKTAQRSLGDCPQKDHQVFLFDTFGELGLFYRLSSIAFVGGSLVPGIGGHNPIEPAQLGCAVLWGPYMENAKDICEILAPYAFPVTPDTLLRTLHMLLRNPSQTTTAGASIKEVALSQKGNLKNLAKLCEPFLGAPSPENSHEIHEI